MLAFDEVHHLLGPTLRASAEYALAPFRLGLTATLERTDGGHEDLNGLLGPVVYRREIDELSGSYLADYESVCLTVHLDEQEREAYVRARQGLYRQFVEIHGIRMGSRGLATFSARDVTFSRTAGKPFVLGRRAVDSFRARVRSYACLRS